METKPDLRISAILCTYNRAALLLKALEAVNQQQLNRQMFELVLVDNNSTDGTAEAAQNYLEAHPDLPARYILEPRQGLSHARNTGIEAAQAPIVTFLDDDAVAYPNLLVSVLVFFGHHPQAMAVGGKVKPLFEGEEPDWLTPYVAEVVSEVDFGEEPFKLKNSYPRGTNMSFRKEVFAKVGFFDPQLGRKGNAMAGKGEKDLFDRMRQAGMEIWYDPNQAVDHIVPQSRLQRDYIRNFCLELGRSEYFRMSREGSPDTQYFSIKMRQMGSRLLAAWYLAGLKATKARMIIDMTDWVVQGFEQARREPKTK